MKYPNYEQTRIAFDRGRAGFYNTYMDDFLDYVEKKGKEHFGAIFDKADYTWLKSEFKTRNKKRGTTGGRPDAAPLQKGTYRIKKA